MIGVIADDITGAAEIGAVGLRYGLRAEVVIAGEPSRDADLVCIDTDSRSCRPTEAARRAAEAALMLCNCGAKWIYKKTDSVLRGNVTPEIEAIAKAYSLSGALLVPANPSLGRTIANGRYFVNSRPIHETDFARDPHHPRLSPNVTELLDRSETLPVSVITPDEPFPPGGIAIGEVSSPADVHTWAARRTEDRLMAGGAEFFEAILRHGGINSTAGPEAQQCASTIGGRELFVSGSATESAQKFVAAQAGRGVPVFSLPEKLATDDTFTSEDVLSLAGKVHVAFQTHPRVILNIGLPQVKNHLLAELLALHLVRVAEEVLHHSLVNHVYAEGGATAVALARRMGWARLGLVAELAPGVATLTVADERPMQLTIKPGSYAWPEAILKFEPCSA